MSAAETPRVPAALTPLPEAILASATVAPSPQFHGPRVVGVRPGTLFRHSLAVTVDLPLKFSVAHLPAGLRFDPVPGALSGVLKKAGESLMSLRVSNAQGAARTTLRVVTEDTLALTPPMGWIACLKRGAYYGAAEIEALSRSLRTSGRSVLLSLSPGPAPVNCDPHL